MSSEKLYSYIDELRSDVTINPLYLEDICLVIVGYHNCYAKILNEVVEIDEIVSQATADDSAMFGDLFKKLGIDIGVEVVGSLAKLIMLRKRNSYVLLDLKSLPEVKDTDWHMKHMIEHIKRQGIQIIDSTPTITPMQMTDWFRLPVPIEEMPCIETTEYMTEEEAFRRYNLGGVN